VKKTVVVIAVIALMALVGFGAWYFKGAPKTYSGALQPITLGGLVSDTAVLLFAAEERHFFEENGINFTFKTYDTGVATVDDLLNNKMDVAGPAEYPVVRKAFERANIRIIASIDKSYVIYFVGLTDKGIRNTADIKGKKIGLVRGSIAEFYLGRFLDLLGMSIRDVTLINLSPAQAADAIARGSVDAVVTWEPYVDRIRKQYPNRVVSWSVQSGQAVYAVLICRNDWIKEHPDLAGRFLTALAQAEAYIGQYPAEAKAILRKRYHEDDEYLARIWPEHQFSLSLDQSLVLALEDEARWMIGNNLTMEKQVPDFMNYIYENGLKAIKPESVNVIR
jgi:NitT/TauT family transport system substrate-binding protein